MTIRAYVLPLALLAFPACIAVPDPVERGSSAASLQPCRGPCDQSAVVADRSTERLETLQFGGGSFGPEECGRLFDGDGDSAAFFSNGIYPMSCAAWFPNRERRVVTRVQVSFCRVNGGSDPGGPRCDPEPATGAGYVVNVGCGLPEIAEGGPDDTQPEGEHTVATFWDGEHSLGDGALHDLAVPNARAGSYVVVRKAFNGDPIDGLLFTLRVWTAAPVAECPAGSCCGEDGICGSCGHDPLDCPVSRYGALDCSFYPCVSSAFSCGMNDYPIAYGAYFCGCFETASGECSAAVNTWISSTLVCLQSAVQDTVNASLAAGSDVSCQSIGETAMDSHPACYTGTSGWSLANAPSMCDLSIGDAACLANALYDAGCLGTFIDALLTQEGREQIAVTGERCVAEGKWPTNPFALALAE